MSHHKMRQQPRSTELYTSWRLESGQYIQSFKNRNVISEKAAYNIFGTLRVTELGLFMGIFWGQQAAVAI